MESVDYSDSFIAVAPDCGATAALEPPERGGKPTVASATYEMIAKNPYRYRSSEVIFTVWADRRSIPDDERDSTWTEFYGKAQACLRSSDLGKRFGWGIHANQDGRIAVYGIGSSEYESLASGVDLDGRDIRVRPAMRSSRR